MKKFIMTGFFTFALVLVALFFAPWSVRTASADTVSYPVTGGTITFDTATGAVTGFTGSPTTVTIPDTIAGFNVTSIGDNAFMQCLTITSIDLPSGVTSIGHHAFDQCTSLNSISIPSSVTSLGEYAFYKCTSLTNIDLPSGITIIRRFAFYKTGIDQISLPSGVTEIWDHAFACCPNLKNVNLPSGLTKIEDWAFGSCSSLTSINLPGSVSNIGTGVFVNCSNLAAAWFYGNAPTMGSGVFDNAASGFKVYYLNGTTGFTSTWYGYTAAPFDCSFTVSSPASGVVWVAGTTQKIAWTSTGNPGNNVKIELYKKLNIGPGPSLTQLDLTITSNTALGSGCYYWSIPTDHKYNGTNLYSVKLTSDYSSLINDGGSSFTIKPPGSIQVTSPAGGESWLIGSTQQITWTYTDNPGNYVKIELLKGSTVCQTITASTPMSSSGMGSYAWTIPADLGPGTDYKIQITSTAYDIISDVSDAAFTITVPGTVTLTAPNGGQNWSMGSTQNITWNYTGNPGTNVKIELLKGSSVVKTISSGTPVGSSGTGSYAWSVPADLAAGADYKIKITSTAYKAVSDSSNACFTIDIPRMITVTAPNGEQKWTLGSTHNITWTYAGNPSASVKIELLKGSTVNRVITAAAPIGSSGSGSYGWIIPNNLSPGSDYKIRVTSTAYSTVTDSSDTNFTIAAPGTVKVTSPNGGQKWYMSDTRNITWTYTGSPGANVKIELLKGSTVVNTISSSTAVGTSGIGSYAWKIPTNLTNGTDYKIRITSTTYPAVKDYSDTGFAIYLPIRISTPNGGESWALSSTKPITWAYAGSPGTSVKIDLYKGSTLYKTLAASTPIGASGVGSYSWKLPSNLPLGSTYRVKASVVGTAYSDLSNTYFSICSPIKVTQPNGGQAWKRGTTQQIKWTYTGNPGSTVKIELFKGGVLNRTIAASVSIGSAGAGTYNWTIPSAQTLGSDYRIKITSTSNAVYTDSSDTNFSIAATSAVSLGKR